MMGLSPVRELRQLSGVSPSACSLRCVRSASTSDLWVSDENKVGPACFPLLELAWYVYWLTTPPPSPLFFRISRIMDLARNSSQNWHNKGLRGQNLERKGVTGGFSGRGLRFVSAGCTASAGTILKRSVGCAQGQMSQGYVSHQDKEFKCVKFSTGRPM